MIHFSGLVVTAQHASVCCSWQAVHMQMDCAQWLVDVDFDAEAVMRVANAIMLQQARPGINDVEVLRHLGNLGAAPEATVAQMCDHMHRTFMYAIVVR
jgi:transcriptional regulator GlxA family with amidase domain